MTANRRPPRWPSLTPRPSLAWNARNSVPSEPTMIRPSVSTPSQSMAIIRIRLAFSWIMGGTRIMATSEHLGSPQVVDLNDAEQAAGGLDDGKRGDLALFHDAQGIDGERSRRDRR